MVTAKQPDIVTLDKQQRKAVVVDIIIPTDGSIRKKEHQKAGEVPAVRGALGAVTQQIPGETSDVCVQKSTVLGAASTLRGTLSLPGLWWSTRA